MMWLISVNPAKICCSQSLLKEFQHTPNHRPHLFKYLPKTHTWKTNLSNTRGVQTMPLYTLMLLMNTSHIKGVSEAKTNFLNLIWPGQPKADYSPPASLNSLHGRSSSCLSGGERERRRRVISQEKVSILDIDSLFSAVLETIRLQICIP